MTVSPSVAGSAPLTVPYCGAPPAPSTLMERWNLDPVLIAVLMLVLIGYGAVAERRAPWRNGCFYAGWTLGALALISPLCPLSVSLFSARVAQHLVLTTVVAPLVALGQPGKALARLVERCGRGRLSAGGSSPLLAAGGFAAALWVWHAPGPYAATFASDLVYWTMHLTTFGAAVWLWATVLDGAGARLAASVAAVFLTTGQMSLLGALITFAGRPLYAPHVLTPFAWGLTPLEDQQLGGVLMWLPAGAIFAAGLIFAFVSAMRRAEGGALAAGNPP